MSQDRRVRVRFAPSPTGPLHIGGVRTALYNYLFAKKHGGDFLLRIEDTDQTRYVDGAEDYILESLSWLGLTPDESIQKDGGYGPYRQSERREIYKEHVEKLLASGHAYYAFDSAEDLEAMREREKANGIHTPKYDQTIRMTMKNSLTLSKEEVSALIEKGDNVTVRMKVPADQQITFQDVIRGEVTFSTNELDDKVIMKADGLPTYHMANVVDDRLMAISHVIRGEEWLSSTAHHVLLYRSFGWQDEMPLFAHLPLILKPSGKGKLSKRDGAKFGFPVFPLEWYDQKEEETFLGFREAGFLPQALINFLSLLGWSPGDDREKFTLSELSAEFSLDNINKAGAQFNYEKAQWFNQQYIIAQEPSALYEVLKCDFPAETSPAYAEQVIRMLQPRVTFLQDFKKDSTYFFAAPTEYDAKMLKKKYKVDHHSHFEHIATLISTHTGDAQSLQDTVKSYIKDNELGFGAILPVLRICITGSMAGPDLFEMMDLIGAHESAQRIHAGITEAEKLKSNA